MTTELDDLTEHLNTLISQAESKFILMSYGVSAEVPLDGSVGSETKLHFTKHEGKWGFHVTVGGPMPCFMHWSHASRATRSRIPINLDSLRRALEGAASGEARRVREAIAAADRFLATLDRIEAKP